MLLTGVYNETLKQCIVDTCNNIIKDIDNIVDLAMNDNSANGVEIGIHANAGEVVGYNILVKKSTRGK